jgi:hypothetical protein
MAAKAISAIDHRIMTVLIGATRQEAATGLMQRAVST